MALELVTGYTGSAHIGSEDFGDFNAAVFGKDCSVVDVGGKLAASLVNANTVLLQDGNAMMYGRHVRLAPGDTQEVSIANGASGQYRHDLICIRYEKAEGTLVESCSFVVKQGTPTSGVPVDPSYVTNSILDGAAVSEMPLWRVKLNGINASLEQVYILHTKLARLTKYSTEEQFTGEYWEDDKPIYRRNFKGTITQGAASINTKILQAASPIENIVKPAGGTVHRDTSGNNFISLPMSYSTTNFAEVEVYAGALTMYSLMPGARTNAPYNIWVEYTKK